MELETAEQRRKFVGDLIDRALKFMDDMNTENKDEDNDWGGASVVLDDLAAVETMIETEQIFIDTLAELENPIHSDHDGQELFARTFEDGFDEFIQNILLRRLNHAATILDEWGFRTKRGVEFKDDFYDKIDTLIELYQELYDF